MQDLSGRRLGKYLVEAPIARGGMARVYRGRDTTLGRPVAIKVLDPAYGEDAPAAERFRREAITAAGLQHPNIVPVYDVRDEDGVHYIAMRYVPGETLRDRLQREGTLPLDQIVPILRAVASALTYAHQQGVVHRDVKPGNILLEPDGRVMLTDFGIARSASQAHLTRSGQVLGTPHYTAPEVLLGREAGPASDTYALGVLLYEMLSGHPPFDGDDLASVLYRQVHDPPPPLRTGNSDLDAALRPILDRVLNKNPALRYPTPDAFAADLSQVATQVPEIACTSAVRPGAALPPPPVSVAAPARPAETPVSGVAVPAHPHPSDRSTGVLPRPGASDRRRALFLGGLVMLVLGGLLLGGLFLRGRNQTADAANYAPPAPTTYTGPLRKGTATDIHLLRALHPPTIDGALDEWPGAATFAAPYVILHPDSWKGAADLSATFFSAYDAAAFYVAVVVTDNLHVQNDKTRGIDLWKGDDVELWFDFDLAGDFDRPAGNADDVQVGLSPGDFAKLGPEAVFFRPATKPAPEIQVAAHPRPGGNGYTLEAAIPWAAVGFRPAAGQVIGFAASVGDNDSLGTAQQEHMVSTCQHLQWNVPPTFGNLFF